MEVLMDVGGGWLSRFLDGGRPVENAAKVNNPARAFQKPSDVVNDTKLSDEEKKKALNTWEQNARQLMTASNEGMPGRKEGVDLDDHHQMGQGRSGKGSDWREAKTQAGALIGIELSKIKLATHKAWPFCAQLYAL
jgi:hypothetical protein